MPWVNCKICNNKFYAKPRHIELGWGKYCSKKCQFTGQRSGKNVNCDNCGKEIYRTPNDFKKSKNKNFFCSKSCLCTWKNNHLFFGKDNINWKNGKCSYRSIIIRTGIEIVCKICNNADKRVLIVHHKDKNRKNNDIKNLVWLCRNCHCLVHNHNQEIK